VPSLTTGTSLDWVNHRVGLRKGPTARSGPDEASTAANVVSEARSESRTVEREGASVAVRWALDPPETAIPFSQIDRSQTD